MPFLRDRAAVAESQPLSQNRGNCGPFSTDDLAILTLFLLVLLNPAASRDVRPTPSVLALTSRAGVSLSFVFLTPSAPLCAPGAPGLSLDPVSAPEFQSSVRSLVARIPRLTVSVCSLVGAGPRVRCSPVQVATASQRPNTVAPSPFCLSSDICVRFHSSPLHTSILSTGDVHL